MFMVLDFSLKGNFTFCSRSGPNCVQERNRGAKGRLYVSVCCTWKILSHVPDLFENMSTSCVLLVCEALWSVLWGKSTGLSLSAQRGHRDLVETVWWAGLHKYCMSNYYYVEWVKRSIRVCEVGQMKVKLYTHCTSPLFKEKVNSNLRHWMTLSWREEKERMWEKDRDRKVSDNKKKPKSCHNTVC